MRAAEVIHRVARYLGWVMPDETRPARRVHPLGTDVRSGKRELVVIVVFVPEGDAAAAVRDAAAEAGAGAIGNYRACSFSVSGEGRFEPMAGADPAIGHVGAPELVQEQRIEVVCRREFAAEALRAMLAAHPYEVPAHHVYAALDPRTL